MKKATLIIWVIILGFIALVIFQNQPFFLAKNSFMINLGVIAPYQSPEIANAILFLIFFVCGLVIAYLFGISMRFKARRTTKRLNAVTAKQEKELSDLKSELETLKSVETPVGIQADTVKLDMNNTRKISTDAAAEKPVDKPENLAVDRQTSNPSEKKAEGSKEKKK